MNEVINKPTILNNELDEKHVKNDPWPLERINRALGVTIYEDYTTKQITFHGTLLNYTDSDQLNINLGGESSIGKTYIALSITDLFPQEDVFPLGYCSQKSFFHDHGMIIGEGGDEILPRGEYVDRNLDEWIKKNPRPESGGGVQDWRADLTAERRTLKREWDEVDKRFLVDLHQKILIFKDMPQAELLGHLRSLLSHDQKDLNIKIAPRGGEMERTQNIVLRGYPTVLFCMANSLENEQDQTRFIMLSPEDTQEKLDGSLHMLAVKMQDDYYYRDGVNVSVLRNALIEDIKAVKDHGVCRVLIREEHMKRLLEEFKSKRKALAPRDQRDFPHIVRIGKARAMINIRNRNQIGCMIVAEERDLMDSLKLFSKIHESVKYGIPPHIYTFYKTLIKGIPEIQTRKQIQQKYLREYKRPIGTTRLANFVTALCGCGLIAEVVGQDKRFKHVMDLGEQNQLPPYLPPENPEITEYMEN